MECYEVKINSQLIFFTKRIPNGQIAENSVLKHKEKMQFREGNFDNQRPAKEISAKMVVKY